MKKTIALLAVLLVLTASFPVFTHPASANPKTIVVPDDYSTISAAIASAADGDTILVKKGTYNEVLVIDKALTLQGEDKEETTVNGDNKATVVLIRHDSVNFTGFTVIYDETPNTPKSLWMWSTRLAGIHVLSAKNCNVSGNKVTDCGGGIWLFDASQNTVADNFVASNDYGIRVEASPNNTLTGNTVQGNWGGLWLISAPNNKFKDNKMVGNVQNFGLSSNEPPHFLNDLDSSNTVDGKPIYYWINVLNRAVPAEAGCVVLVNCEDVKIQGLRLSKNKDGIVLAGTRNSVVADNIITESGSGITAYDSLSDIITGNNINANTAISVNGDGTKILSNAISASSVGVSTNGSYITVAGNSIIVPADASMIKCAGSYTNITRNNLKGSSYTYAIIDGDNNIFYENVMTNSYQVRVSGDGNIIAKNNVTGVTISEGSGNVVCANRITNGLGLAVRGHDNLYYANQVENNYYVGVDVGIAPQTSGNTVYHNNFVNNQQQVKNFGGSQANSWDNGAEGNYWSDYNGSDLNGDGIGDTPYFIKGEKLDEELRRMVEVVSGQDNYPLMAPFNINIETVTVPEWNYSMPIPSPAPTLTPSPPPFPTPIQTPSLTPLETPSPSVSPSPSPLPTFQLIPADSKPRSTAFPMEIIYAIAGTAATAAVIAVAALVLRRRR